jgi:hypothetical protein
MKMTFNTLGGIFAALLLLASCASAGAPSSGTASSKAASKGAAASGPAGAPAWVSRTNTVYPDAQWLAFVESAGDKDTAQNKALADLATAFNTSITSLTQTNQNYQQVVKDSAAQKSYTLAQTQGVESGTTALSQVSGLVGVQTDVWNDTKNNKVYVCARMNRQECAARYSTMVDNNQNTINSLLRDAAQSPATFDAYEKLLLAKKLAQITDSFHSILTVLDPSKVGTKLSYGDAESVNVLLQKCSQAIVVSINVTGDTNDMLTKAFQSLFDSYGFPTVSAGQKARYSLVAKFETGDAGFASSKYSDIYWTLTAALTAQSSRESIMSFEKTDRARSLNRARTEALVLRNAVEIVSSGEFKQKFDAYLNSLLK